MDLTILFSPLDESIYHNINSSNSIFQGIQFFGEKMPDYKKADIAIFGIEEDRGTSNNSGCRNAPNEIRKKLYALKRGSGKCNMVDLGNLNIGVDINETYIMVGKVCRTLLDHGVLPILLGGTHDLDYGQYRGYEDMDKLISLLNIDAFLDLDDTLEAAPSSRHIYKILLHEPNYLFGYTHLAHQTYLIDPSRISFLDKLYFDTYRVGCLRSNMEEIEPIIRSADMASFDITALRSTDAPGNANAQPFGLTGEEACHICWYAGINEKLSSIGFYEYNPDKDDDRQKTASVVATMIWYFIEGYHHRKNRKNFRGNDFVKYTVPVSIEPDTLVFYKSKWTEKWWMEVNRYRATTGQYSRASIIPCSYQDYQMATQGDLPERYILAMAKSS